MAGPKRYEITFEKNNHDEKMYVRTASSEELAVVVVRSFGYEPRWAPDVQEHELNCVRGHPEEEYCRDRYGDTLMPEKEPVS